MASRLTVCRPYPEPYQKGRQVLLGDVQNASRISVLFSWLSTVKRHANPDRCHPLWLLINSLDAFFSPTDAEYASFEENLLSYAGLVLFHLRTFRIYTLQTKPNTREGLRRILRFKRCRRVLNRCGGSKRRRKQNATTVPSAFTALSCTRFHEALSPRRCIKILAPTL